MAEAGACGAAGAVFFSLVFLALTSLTTVDLLVNERGLVVKESLGGYYRPVSYYLSKGEPPGLQPAAAAAQLALTSDFMVLDRGGECDPYWGEAWGSWD